MITFKHTEPVTGLARVTAGPRGWHIKWNGKKVGSVSYVGRGLGSVPRPMGWFFCVHDPLPYINTCNEPVDTPEEAKAKAKAYVQAALKRRTETAKDGG